MEQTFRDAETWLRMRRKHSIPLDILVGKLTTFRVRDQLMVGNAPFSSSSFHDSHHKPIIHKQTQHKEEKIEEEEEETEEDLSLLLTKCVVVDVVVPFVDLSAVMFDHKYRIALDRFGAQELDSSQCTVSFPTNCSEWALRASIESFRISRCDTPRLDLPCVLLL